MTARTGKFSSSVSRSPLVIAIRLGFCLHRSSRMGLITIPAQRNRLIIFTTHEEVEDVEPYLLYFSRIITVLLSVPYLITPKSLMPFVLSLITVGLLSYFGKELFAIGLRSLKVLITLALTAVLALLDVYAVIPLVAFAITVYLYLDKKLTYSRALTSSTISAFSYPIAYSVSSYATLMAPLLLLQARGS